MKKFETIQHEVTNADGNGTSWLDLEVENYKGFGLEEYKKYKSGNKTCTAYYVIHMSTGKVIPALSCETRSITKSRINFALQYVTPDMDYKKIEDILRSPKVKLK